MHGSGAIKRRCDDDDEAEGFIGSVRALCGAEIAASLCERAGGGRVCIPRDPQPHHVACKIIGIDAVKAISVNIGFGEFEVPSGRRRRLLIERLCLEGKTASEVTRESGCGRRTVFNTRARLRREGRMK